jgi:hypothetical protein
MLKLGIPLYLNKTTFSTQYSLAELTRMLAPRRRAIEEEYVRPRREGKSTLVSRLVSNRKNVRRFIN